MEERKFTEWLKDIKKNGTPEQKAKTLAELEKNKKEEEKRITEKKKRDDDDTLMLCLIACM